MTGGHMENMRRTGGHMEDMKDRWTF